MSNKNSVWVCLEQTGGKIAGVSYEMLSGARKLANELSGEVCAVLMGHQVQAQAKDGAEEIPVGKLLAAAPGAPQGADGTALPVPLPVLRLLPVGQEGAYGALRSLVPAEEEVAGMAAGVEQVFHTHPLLWG